MISMQTGGTTPMTKLMVLQNAVNIITQLQQQVRGKKSATKNDSINDYGPTAASLLLPSPVVPPIEP